MSYQHCPACWVQQLEQTGFSFSAAGFGFLGPRPVWALGSRHHRGAAELCGTTHKTVKRVVERAEAGGEPPQREPRPRNFDAVRDLVANGSPSQEARSRPSGCCRSPARPVMSARRGTFAAWFTDQKALWRDDNHRGRRPAVWSPGEYLVIDWAEAAPGLFVFCAVLALAGGPITSSASTVGCEFRLLPPAARCSYAPL